MLATLALVVPGSVGAQGTGAVVASSSTGATGVTGQTGPPAVLSASVTACHADPLQANRSATFSSQMTSVPGTKTMDVNFELQEHTAAAIGFAAVSAPGFGEWVASQPGVGIFTNYHQVTSLPAPASFRVLVRARWLDRRRRVIRREQIVSPVCVQPLETPDLAIGVLRRAPGPQAGTVLYSLQVLNTGAAGAGPFQVSLTVNGAALADASVTGLSAGAAAIVQFEGPACTAGSTLSAVADPTGAVVEPANHARSKTFPCTR